MAGFGKFFFVFIFITPRRAALVRGWHEKIMIAKFARIAAQMVERACGHDQLDRSDKQKLCLYFLLRGEREGTFEAYENLR